MRRAVRYGFFLLLLLLAVTSVGAQSAHWEVLLYDGAEVLVVTAEGVSQTIKLPAEARSLEPVADRYIAISPDRQYLAFSKTAMTNDGFTSSLYIANLDTGECCVSNDSRLTQNISYVQVGPFNSTSNRLFVAVTRWLPEDEIYESAFLIVNPATGEILQQAEPGSLWDTHDNTTLLPEWTNTGLILYPTCIPCEGIFDGTAWLWDPDAGTAEELDIFYTGMGDRLPATGEYIYAVEDDDYALPAQPYPVNYNVVAYRADGTAKDAPKVIYHQPGQFVPRPMWGLDGAAYLLQAPVLDSAVIIDRRGMIESIELPAGIVPLAGTPDGWLLWSQSDGSLYHVTRWTDGLIHAEVIGSTAQSAQWPQVLERPALGASLAGVAMQSAVR